MGYRVAVVGATGNVGGEMLQILAERKFPVDEVVALASERSLGKQVSFGDERTLEIQDLAGFDFRGFDIGLFSPGAKVSAEFAPKAATAGCVVIDLRSVVVRVAVEVDVAARRRPGLVGLERVDDEREGPPARGGVEHLRPVRNTRAAKRSRVVVPVAAVGQVPPHAARRTSGSPRIDRMKPVP